MLLNRTKLSAALLALLSTLNASSSFAGAMADAKNIPDAKIGNFLLHLGGYIAEQGKEQNIFIRGVSVGNLYTLNDGTQGSGLVGVGYFLNGASWDRFKFSYGANVFFLGQTTIKGQIIEEHLFKSFAYGYKIQNIPLYFEGKTVIDTNSDAVKVAVDAGIGPNFISTSQYKEIALAGLTIRNDSFNDHDNVDFAATAGIALRFNNNTGLVPLECGYRFFYLGQGNLARRNGDILNDLKTGHNYANALACTVTI